MGSYLIDSHVLLWSVENAPKLSKLAGDIINDKNNRIFVSIASLWEIHVKVSIGKLNIKPDFFEILDAADYRILNIEKTHLTELITLPHIHRDPFDRMIVAQARVEKCKLITADPEIMKYDLKWIGAGE